MSRSFNMMIAIIPMDLTRLLLSGGALALCLLGTGIGAHAAKSGNSRELRLTQFQAHCLVDNIEVFLRDDHDPVTVYFDLCLNEEQLTDLAQGNSRQSLPDLENPAARAQKDGAATSEMSPLKISKATLRCLRTKAHDPNFLERDPIILQSSGCKR